MLTFDDSGRLTRAEGQPILLDSSVAPDARIAARVKDLAAPIEQLKQKFKDLGLVVVDEDWAERNRASMAKRRAIRPVEATPAPAPIVEATE